MRIAFVATLALTLAACSQEPDAPAESEPEPAAQPSPVAPAPAPEAEPEVLGAIPARFRGAWDAMDGDCSLSSDLRIEIGANTLGFYEARGQVTDIMTDGEDAIIAGMAMEGQGERWTMTRRFALTDTDRLIPSPVGEEAGFEPMTLKRCES
ncbi:hypothetical protein A9995_08720 [Erythrobacter sp. QSSC1-22B]|uniref:hypothetical protein n=1 Tax=Erythrobacter sp. QSSC1-22B TaxID=1860125 RepID=UPI000805C8EC|nr:hypothetical protein [Erythrobacter sp. QSSC1-22B]OBX19202.1 hypothetical protein A9995_08720 [Erythrobacter sp. QSSC1-22B]